MREENRHSAENRDRRKHRNPFISSITFPFRSIQTDDIRV